MEQKYCIFCKNEAEKTSDNFNRNTYSYDCKNICGQFEVKIYVNELIENAAKTYGTERQTLDWRKLRVNCVSKMIEYKDQFPNQKIAWSDVDSNKNSISENNLESFNIYEFANNPIEHRIKKNKLLDLLYQKAESQGDPFSILVINLKDCWSLKIYPGDPPNHDTKELELWLKELEKDELVSEVDCANSNAYTIFNMGLGSCKLTPKAWTYHSNKEKVSNKVFIAMQFSWVHDKNESVEIQKAIKKVCKELGYEASIVTQNHIDNISLEILNAISKAKFVIADFTYNNRGVYFEAGYARGKGIPVFHIIKKGFNKSNRDAEKEGKKLHFDIQQIMYREYKDANDLYKKLKNWIENLMGEYRQ